MSYTFATTEDQALAGKLQVRTSADSYTLTAEFSSHPYSPYKTWTPTLTAPVVSNGVNLTLNLTPTQVNTLKDSYFRIRAVKSGTDIYIEDGRLIFTPAPVQNASIAINKLGFDVATQAELDAAISGVNAAVASVAGSIPSTSGLARISDIGNAGTATGSALKSAVDAEVAALGVVSTAVVYRTVAQDGSGNYASIAAANSAITDASISKQYVVWIQPGEYDHSATPDVTPKPYIKYIGVDENLVRVTLLQPNNSTDAAIVNNSAFKLTGDAWLENMTIEVANARYPIHDESANSSQDWTHTLKRVKLIHRGNGGARTWRDANPATYGAGNTVSNTAEAYGYGASSGGTLLMEDCLMVSETYPWGVHNNAGFSRPNKNILRRCRFVCTDDRFGSGPQIFLMQALGSGTPDEVLLENCELDGVAIGETDSPWLRLNGKQSANHSEYRLTMVGCPPVAFTSASRGLGLMIQSAGNGNTSKVRFSGTAVPILIGQQRYRDGGGGLRGYAYGELDMSGITGGQGAQSGTALVNTLAKRLGNRTGSPITLTVAIDANSPVDVVFNADYSAQSNSTILGIINGAIGAQGTASLYNVSQGETYPQVIDHQKTIKNNGVSGIPRWAGVVYDNKPGNPSTTKVWARKMITTDPAASLVGIALEPIPPGAVGRILTEGILTTQQIFGSGVSSIGGSTLNQMSGTFAAGTQLYADDTLDGGFTTTVGSGRKVGESIYSPTSGGSYFYFKGQAQAVPTVDPIETVGSLLLIDPTHPSIQWPVGVPNSGDALANILGARAQSLTGTATAIGGRTYRTGSGLSDGTTLLERSGRGGVHAVVDPSDTTAPSIQISFYADTGIWNYMRANLTHKFYFSIWHRITRPATPIGASTHTMWAGGAAYPLIDNDQTEDSPLGARPATNIVGPEFRNAANSTTFGGDLGATGPNNMALFIGANGGVSFNGHAGTSLNQMGSHIFYRAYIEDLTVSGRTWAQVDALDYSLFTKEVLTAGGRYYADTYTSPTTVFP